MSDGDLSNDVSGSDVSGVYDATARHYDREIGDELDAKPLYRAMLGSASAQPFGSSLAIIVEVVTSCPAGLRISTCTGMPAISSANQNVATPSSSVTV
ncbi:MAG: hypothetical protein QOE01_2913 [Actinomycetota bacterium]|nr:hypothetical protein [Actinomycetota bacterium]